MRAKTTLVFLATLMFLGASLIQAGAQAGASEVLEAKWWPSANAFAQGQTYPMVIRLVVKPGLHINSNDPGDPNVIPTKIQFSAPQGLSLAQVKYPAAKKIKLGFAEKPLAVFDGAVMVRTTLQVADDAKPGDYKLIAKISFQGCDNNVCFMPETLEAPLMVKVVPAGQKVLRLNRDMFAR